MISYINDANTMIYLVDEGFTKSLSASEPDMFMDLSELFPGNPNVDGQRYFLKGTVLEETIGAKNIPEELAFVIRTENHAGSHPENYDHAVELLTNVVNGVKTTDESDDRVLGAAASNAAALSAPRICIFTEIMIK